MKNTQNQQLLKEIKSAKSVSSEALFEGAQLCYQNAKELHEISKCATEKGTYSLAVSLSVLAAEELSKLEMMMALSLGCKNSPADWFIFWKVFSGEGHKIKLRAFYTFNSSFGEDDLDKIIDNSWKSRQIAETAKSVKESGFYIDFDKKSGKFFRKKVDKKQAEEWIEKIDNSLRRNSHITELSFGNWKKISQTTRECILPDLSYKIFNAVGEFRKNKI